MIEHKSILTQHPEEEIWYYLSKLISRHHVKRLLARRISNSEVIARVQSLKTKKEEYNKTLDQVTDKDHNRSKIYLEIYHLLPDKELDVNTEEICITVKQAIELYNASKNLSMYAKPIVLYYCYARLARILFLCTYSTNFVRRKNTKSHGLTMNDNDITCLNAGAFVRFHDSFSVDSSIYTANALFDWKSLLTCSATQHYYLFENMRGDNFVNIKNKRNNQSYRIHELTRELLFAYSMSRLARYEVKKWKAIIESDENDVIWTVDGYLKSTQSFFPNLILNELHGLKFFFYSEMRTSPDKPDFEI